MRHQWTICAVANGVCLLTDVALAAMLTDPLPFVITMIGLIAAQFGLTVSLVRAII